MSKDGASGMKCRKEDALLGLYQDGRVSKELGHGDTDAGQG